MGEKKRSKVGKDGLLSWHENVSEHDLIHCVGDHEMSRSMITHASW